MEDWPKSNENWHCEMYLLKSLELAFGLGQIWIDVKSLKTRNLNLKSQKLKLNRMTNKKVCYDWHIKCFSPNDFFIYLEFCFCTFFTLKQKLYQSFLKILKQNFLFQNLINYMMFEVIIGIKEPFRGIDSSLWD